MLGAAQVPETNPNALAGVNWIFGKNIWLDFSNGTLSQKRIISVEILEGTSSYSDSFNFYYLTGDGGFQSKLHLNDSIITTGFNDDGGQGVLFLVHKSNENLWFFGSGRGGNGGYSKIKSDTKTIEYIRFPTDVGEKQQAVNHQNGRDIWYANHAREGDSVFFFLLQRRGLLECPVVTRTGLDYNSGEFGWATQGQMKFSPDGRFLAEVTSSSPFGYGIYRFDNEYPRTDSIYILQKGFTSDYTKRWAYGLAFSPNGEKIYVSAGRANDIQEPNHPPVVYQLDFDSLKNDVNGSSWVSLDSLWGIEDGALQLAPDGKIYCARPNQTYLSVINNPNEQGAACSYVRQGLKLDSGGTSRYGLPTFNQSYFYTPAIDFQYEEDCFTNTYSFGGRDTLGATSWKWLFRDIRNETVEVRLDKNVFYSFPQADSLENKYEVTFIASNGSVSDTVIKTLTIRPKLTDDFLGRDTFYCEGSNPNLTLQTPANMHCIHWGVGG